MKSKMMKKLFTAAMVAVMVVGSFAGCNKTTEEADPVADENAVTQAASATDAPAATEAVPQVKGGTIMWLSNLSSGSAYDGAVNYATMICSELGYDFQVVYGDMYNDPAANLTAVKNGMTKDVVAIIMSQDGGVKDIMAEYPEIYVAGYNTDMASVYGEGGASAEVVTNAKFLGTICDGYFDGTLTGQAYAQRVIDKGYKKVATMIFPVYAYPQNTVADLAFRAEIAKYNESAAADQQIVIVGDAKVLEFAPLDESYFLEEGNSDLDAIVGMLAGTDFIYPAMKSAMSNGSCSKDMKLITGGFNTDESIIADIGGEGVIQSLSFSPTEDIAWSIIMLDNALSGTMYSDYSASERVSSLPYVISSKEDIDNVMSKSMTGTTDITLTQLTIDDIKSVLVRYTATATYADLKALFQNEKLSVASLATK
ncbi:MAG: hypothetical protein WBI07_09735 [Mobilitalea sp.]